MVAIHGFIALLILFTICGYLALAVAYGWLLSMIFGKWPLHIRTKR